MALMMSSTYYLCKPLVSHSEFLCSIPGTTGAQSFFYMRLLRFTRLDEWNWENLDLRKLDILSNSYSKTVKFYLNQWK